MKRVDWGWAYVEGEAYDHDGYITGGSVYADMTFWYWPEIQSSYVSSAGGSCTGYWHDWTYCEDIGTDDDPAWYGHYGEWHGSGMYSGYYSTIDVVVFGDYDGASGCMYIPDSNMPVYFGSTMSCYQY